MRILDLGAHDGFVSAYIADKWKAVDDQELHIDGIELNEHGVEIFNRRLQERGIGGECKVGAAEDAPSLFEEGTYDAVVAYELIEHVPDVELFLWACELMLATNGRIYLSTPDGTFGAGQNPHHLRVYRAVDLADIIRRRGDIQAMGVGEDTISMVSYTPWRALEPALPCGRGEVAIFAGAGWKTWSPLGPEMPGGLGGSETAAVRLGEALTRLGYMVTTYGEVDPGLYGQVIYRHYSAFDPTTPRDALIVSRTPQLGERYLQAGRRILWMHDTDYGPELTPKRAQQFEDVMVLSEWHKNYVAQVYPFLIDKLTVTGNGITPEYFDSEDVGERNPHRAIYSSSPDRGLDLLLEWWPKVRERVPDAELAYCYADVYQTVAGIRPEVGAHFARIQELAKQPGVINLGALSQRELAQQMQMCGVWLAPSWTSWIDQRFNETFCIGAVEAAAAGCSLVVSDWGALPERLNTAMRWRLVPADNKPVEEDWVAAIAGELLSPDPFIRSEAALEQTWDLIAQDFDARIRRGNNVWLPVATNGIRPALFTPAPAVRSLAGRGGACW